VSPFLAFVGVSVVGTWGLASIGLIVGGIFLLVDPSNAETASGATLPGIVLIIVGLASAGAMGLCIAPLMGIDPPFTIPAKKIIPAAKLTRWVNVGLLRELPDGTPKEIRVKGQRVLFVRRGDNVYALGGLCSHARLPMGGFPGSPLKAIAVRDDCVTCPFHGARFDVASGKVVRHPFDSSWNQQHPLLGRMQMPLLKLLSKLPAPPGAPRASMKAEDMQTFPCRVANGEVQVALKERK
jgi:nitrite reductase/ring-hydroxylating ferredoxin subunit